MAKEAELIRRLKALLKSGAIDQQEYDRFKKQVLDGKDLDSLLRELEEDVGKPVAPAAPVAAPVKAQSRAVKAGQAAFGLAVGLFIVAGVFYVMGVNPLDWFTDKVGDCPSYAGNVTCGFCAATLKCQYCSEGYSCNFATPGDTCSHLTCSKGGNTYNGQTIAEMYCNPGQCLSNGHCCPSNARYYCNGQCYYSQSDASSEGCYNFNVYC